MRKSARGGVGGGLSKANADPSLPPMKVVWPVVFILAAVVGGFLTPWDAFRSVVESKGVGEQEATFPWAVAGYTFPLTLATVAIVWLFMHSGGEQWTGPRSQPNSGQSPRG